MDNWNNAYLISLDDGLFVETGCTEMGAICLFDRFQEFANMFVVGLLKDLMVNPQTVFMGAVQRT